jgi:hypothetical protein
LLAENGDIKLKKTFKALITKQDKQQILSEAEKYIKEKPITITAFTASRSAGGKHDFFSEGDYWWPDSLNPDGPYVRRDGLTNPDNFNDHRKALIRFSIQTATVTSAYKITGKNKYAQKAKEHLKAWFVNEGTMMNPNLLYAQAIKGRFTGRGIGIIDAIHFIDVAKSVMVLEEMNALSGADLIKIKKWFASYLQWVTTHQYGKDEMDAKNNHGTCWVMQVAMFAKLVNDTDKIEFCRKRFKEVLMPVQMAPNGSFPLETERTKPYNYSLFNLDAMASICMILSDNKDDLWKYTLPDGRNMRRAIEFMFPYIEDKTKWPFPKDVMFDEFYPVRQVALIFGAYGYGEEKYIKLWKKLNPNPVNEEVIRNYPIRQPVLWF